MLNSAVLVLALLSTAQCFVVNEGTECRVYPESTTHFGMAVDDTPSILQAFELCGTNGSVILTENNTFHINQVMNTTNLLNCDVSILGEMVWSTNVPYWLSHSYSVTYVNLSTSWFFGGTNVTMRGYNKGVFNGNGKSYSFLPCHPVADAENLQGRCGTTRIVITVINLGDPLQ